MRKNRIRRAIRTTAQCIVPVGPGDTAASQNESPHDASVISSLKTEFAELCTVKSSGQVNTLPMSSTCRSNCERTGDNISSGGFVDEKKRLQTDL